MKAFEFGHRLVDSYARFSRSFSTIRSHDLKAEIDRQYDAGRFWPDALLSINPRFLQGPTVDELVVSGDLDEATGRIFRFGTAPLRFHRHQAQSIAKARAGQSYVVTTGTGSGKSLCFFVPVVDAIVRARKAGKRRRTTAIIVYPMNALANSQINEIEKFISQSGLPADIKPVVRRYTGQESPEERQRIADNPPDILLTNFMMAELLLTRQDALDTKVIENANGLDFIVLDELHTYRGRQGADVAVLVRRLRNRCTPDKAPICIGTSATMANEGSDANRAQTVADVASRLFGASIGPESVIDESLERATDDRLKLDEVRPALASALTSELPELLPDELLRKHPLAVWTELAIGLDDAQELKRKKPIPFEEAVALLSEDSGIDVDTCRMRLETFLTRISLPEADRGGPGMGAFLAFKLHQFISGAGEVFTTLTEMPRNVLFEGQLEDPSAPGHRLYPTRFCRECGHEVHVVTKTEDADGTLFVPRNIDDAPIDDQEEDAAGYLTASGDGDPDYAFTGETETYPEDWREERNGIERLRANRKRRMPQMVTVAPDGRYNLSGKSFWFIPGKFGFCPCCLDQPHPSMRERTKLVGLSGEGRSSATTLLVATALEWMNGRDSGVPKEKRKLLGFTDNRQDAALQAGHFNDFLFVSLLRGAILRAVLDAGDDGIAEDEFGLRVVKALGFTAANQDARIHWMLDPEAGAVTVGPILRSLAARLDSLVTVGLGYLRLDRESATLSGGESQRVKMVRHLGSSLTDLTYVFDEPSVGLHPHDVGRLVGLMRQLCDKGNTVLIVEHKPDMIAIADHIVDIGPRAGSQGGEIVYEGDYPGLLEARTLTGDYLTRHQPIKTEVRRKTGEMWIRNARINNLRDVTLAIPQSVLTVVTGVAGSGKTSLVVHGLAQACPDVVVVDQGLARGSRRSNTATWTGILDPIRKAFAKANGVAPGLFSANSKGACPDCGGLGVIFTDLAHLDPIVTTCESCEGKRFLPEVLKLNLRGRSIADVYDMSIETAGAFFTEPAVSRILGALSDVGLGYLTLGQPLSTLSGGERQRLKLAAELGEAGNTYILDEPTSGLHMHDVETLIGVFDRLVDEGSTVVVIDHNLDVIARADWVVDLGPGAGHDGGRVLFEGVPADLINSRSSVTARFLADRQSLKG